jgi:hypothetical protein
MPGIHQHEGLRLRATSMTPKQVEAINPESNDPGNYASLIA